MTENKYPTDLIPLVTRGHFYPEDHPLASGEIELKQMTAKEEDILANSQLRKNGKFLDKLIESLIVNKNIKQEEILIPDKNAIFIAIRRLAYGDEYPITATCPNCSEQNRIVVNLATIENKPFDFDSYPKHVNAFDFKLPQSGVVVTYKLLNQIDEQNVDAELNNIKKFNKDISREYTTRLKYVIVALDGNSDKGSIRKFIDDGKLSAKDSLALRKEMREKSPDIDFSFNFVCNNCSHEGRMNIPMGISFLWPDFES